MSRITIPLGGEVSTTKDSMTIVVKGLPDNEDFGWLALVAATKILENWAWEVHPHTRGVPFAELIAMLKQDFSVGFGKTSITEAKRVAP